MLHFMQNGNWKIIVVIRIVKQYAFKHKEFDAVLNINALNDSQAYAIITVVTKHPLSWKLEK